MPFEGGKDGVVSSVSSISPLDDLEEKAFAIAGGIELEILAVLVTVVEDVFHPKPIAEIRFQAEASLHIVLIIRRDGKELETVSAQGSGSSENVLRPKGEVLNAGAERLGDEMPRERAAVLRAIEGDPQASRTVLEHLAAHHARWIGDIHYRRFAGLEDHVVKKGVQVGMSA